MGLMKKRTSADTRGGHKGDPSARRGPRELLVFHDYTMVPQEILMPNGWPLGLENMNTKLVAAVADSSSQATVVVASEPSSLHMPSYSFSSFSSSGLDTESTASFFIDQSVTLGRLLGMNPRPGKTCALQTRQEMKLKQESGDIICVDGDKEMFRGICVPLLQNIMVMRSKSKGSSRH